MLTFAQVLQGHFRRSGRILGLPITPQARWRNPLALFEVVRGLLKAVDDANVNYSNGAKREWVQRVAARKIGDDVAVRACLAFAKRMVISTSAAVAEQEEPE